MLSCGPGLLDLAGRSPSDGQWRVLTATDDGFADAQVWGASSTNVTCDTILVGDYNGDGRDDVAGLAGTGTKAGFDNIRVGDFNGDGTADIAGLSAGGTRVVGLSDGAQLGSSVFTQWSGTVTWDNVAAGNVA